MNKTEIIEALEKLQESDNIERAHMDADDILCDLLDHIGYGDVVYAYSGINKGYE